MNSLYCGRLISKVTKTEKTEKIIWAYAYAKLTTFLNLKRNFSFDGTE